MNDFADEERFGARLDDWRTGRGPNPRPRRRMRDAAAGRDKCAGETCRLCGGRYAYSRHHLVPRSQGGDDVDANLVRLCDPWRPCHLRITQNEPIALRELRATLTPDEIAYIVERKGSDWLDRRYPEA